MGKTFSQFVLKSEYSDFSFVRKNKQTNRQTDKHLRLKQVAKTSRSARLCRASRQIFPKTESESKPNLIFVVISESDSDPIRFFKNRPNLNQTPAFYRKPNPNPNPISLFVCFWESMIRSPK